MATAEMGDELSLSVGGITQKGRHSTWRAFRRHPGGVIGGGVVVLLTLTAIFASQIAPYDPTKVSARDRVKSPSAEFWMGTDTLGRDVFSRVVYGTRVSLRIGLVSVSIAAVGGVFLGLISGFYGGRVDMICVWFIDTMMAMPSILLAISIVFALGVGLTQVIIAVGISAVPQYARVVRGEVLSVREQPYVEAARSIGRSDTGIMLYHVLPNVFAPVIILMTVGVASAILIGAGLSFLGLGAQPPTPEWGSMVNAGRNTLRTAWWISTFPGIMIAVAVIALNLMGDALRDALDPHLR